jgi:beta-lactamase superfamily II metal-dependent hydrolase
MSNGLDLLAITHPDDDHINNSEKVRNVLYPTLLQRRRLSEFPHEEVHSDSSSYLYYKNNICEYYN